MAKLEVREPAPVHALAVALDELQHHLVLAVLRLEAKLGSETLLCDFLWAGHGEPEATFESSIHVSAHHGDGHDIADVIEIPWAHRHTLSIRNLHHLDHRGGHVKGSGQRGEAAAIQPCLQFNLAG